ncbi:hypothetical protein ACDW_17280 [Acidovorax sp. DW039]|nr:hypothetical protein ACDW_17280 [Acidovorax sp. DW039]
MTSLIIGIAVATSSLWLARRARQARHSRLD